jgi:hypothetical protein
MQHMKYDIVGDIHGHADTLEVLLHKLGYKRKHGVYSHPEGRKMVFVGDFIDRGPKIRETLHLVRAMIESENALAVMGNHEFNAISFHTPHVEKGGFFRDHTFKEIRQHFSTLEQFKYFDSEFGDFLEWFKTLPLFLELEAFRVVHACWDQAQIDFLRSNFNGITRDLLTLGNDKDGGSATYHAVNDTLKGKEAHLPDGHSFVDKDGAERHECRIKWWALPEHRIKLKHIMISCPVSLANHEIPADTSYHSYTDARPVFFGHYWLSGDPEIENPSAICLDYSVAKDGLLVACRLGEKNGVMTKEFVVQRAV